MPLNYNKEWTPAGPAHTVDTQFDLGTVLQGETQGKGTNTVDYLTRPLSELNSIPYRGTVASHAIDNDTFTREYSEDLDPGTEDNHHLQPDEIAAAGDGAEFEEWVPVVPLVVTVVESPVETAERFSRTILAFGPNEFYTFTAVGVSDNLPSRAMVGKDDTRTKLKVIMTGTGFANNQYGFAVSTSESMAGAMLFMPGQAAFYCEFEGKLPLYGRVVPLAAYDSTKPNSVQLSIVAETAILGSRKVR